RDETPTLSVDVVAHKNGPQECGNNAGICVSADCGGSPSRRRAEERTWKFRILYLHIAKAKVVGFDIQSAIAQHLFSAFGFYADPLLFAKLVNTGARSHRWRAR